jgi:hypothetical protein
LSVSRKAVVAQCNGGFSAFMVMRKKMVCARLRIETKAKGQRPGG